MSWNGKQSSGVRMIDAAKLALVTMILGLGTLTTLKLRALVPQIESGMGEEAPLEKIKRESLELHRAQSAALSSALSLGESLAPEPIGLDCSALAPKYEYGVGVLQVASVLESRGDDTKEFAARQATRVRTILVERGISTWSNRLIHYLGRGDKPVWRVVFNNISPRAGAEMCAWLRCEKWTGGCAFIDEKGETHPAEAPKLETPTGESIETEYEPSEDLYAMWKAG